MALTRKMLEAMGVEEKAIEQIIEAHTETFEAIKKERDELKASAKDLSKANEELLAVQKELDELKKGDGFEEKYNSEHAAFEAYKAEVTARETNATKAKLYRELLTAENVDSKRIDTIMKVTNLDEVTLKDGAIENADALKEGIRKDWADFVVSTSTTGAGVANPPSSGAAASPDYSKMSMAEYIAARKAN